MKKLKHLLQAQKVNVECIAEQSLANFRGSVDF